MSQPRVFIIQHPTKEGQNPDFEPALKYGRLEYLFDAGDRAYVDMGLAYAKLEKKLWDFDEQVDYLLPHPLGDPAFIWLLFYWAGVNGVNPCCLYWSRTRAANGAMTNERGYYIKVPFDKVIDYEAKKQSKTKSKVSQC